MKNKSCIYTYVIKDEKEKIISLSFKVDFFVDEYKNKYLECKKAKILIETEDFELDKRTFEEIVDKKITECIMDDEFYKLLESWNFKLINNPEEGILDKQGAFNINKMYQYSSSKLLWFKQYNYWE